LDQRASERRRLRRLGARGPGAKLIFELLVAVLQLLDRTGQLTDLRLQALDAQDLLGGRPFLVFLAGGLLFLPEHAADCRQRRLVLLGGGYGGAGKAKRGGQSRGG